ncbi:uncharacterized protein LOC142767088 [Rhipicephalus microplus]|uniref:uncharacterized protein LOC142767088 n=1 Tax=Rhipicephalus microplus TaxID=6941 RepID=UPI003F6BEE72
METNKQARFKPVTHVIFDLDGVVLDADKVYTAAVEEVAGRYGKTYTWELKKRVMGMPDADAARIVIDTLGLPVSQDYYLYELDRLYENSLPNSKVMPGAEQLIRHLHAHGVPIAANTSSMPLSFGLKMTHHEDVLSLFNHAFISGGDPKLKHGKPNPDIFLISASKFHDHPAPEKVLVFEDTPAGVTAALDAGMQVVMVPDPRMDQENRNRATLCIDLLADFKPELFGLPPYPAAAKKSPSRSESSKDIKPQAPASKFKPVSYVIFDLDGLLLDTEKLYSAAVETVASRYSKNLTWELKKRVLGLTEADAAHTIVEALGLPLAPDEFMVAVDCIYKETAPSAQFMPGAERLVRHLHEHAVPMAIATGSAAPLFNLKMTRHHDVLALFHHVVCAGENPEVKHGKPHPDIFLVVASRFDGKPPSEKVLVFEDVVNGVTAALAAGMQVVMVPDPRIDEEHRRKATTCVTSLLEFKHELFGLPAFYTPAQDPKKLKPTSSGPSLVHHSLTGAGLPT